MENIIKSILFNTFEELLSLLNSLNKKEINQSLDTASWSPGQIGVHLYKSYDLEKILQGRVISTKRNPWSKIPSIEKSLMDLEAKKKAPGYAEPDREYVEKDMLLALLKKRVAIIKSISENTDLSKTCMDFEFDNYGFLTRLEWLAYTAYHTKRHISQLDRRQLPN